MIYYPLIPNDYYDAMEGPTLSKRYTDDTSNDGCCILWLCVTMRSNELLSLDSDYEPCECTTSDWTGYT